MGLVTQLWRDAHELARAIRGGYTKRGEGEPSAREAARAAATQDGYKVLAVTRLREAARRWHIPGMNHTLRLAQTVLYGIEIGNEVSLGDGVTFVHTLGTVVGGDAKVGARVRFMGNNTIGTAKDNGCPVIEDDVVIGCGARILGPVRVGRGAIIGANAVVLSDVAPGSVVAGIPARPVPPRDRARAPDDDHGDG